jgi:hypothetical protein
LIANNTEGNLTDSRRVKRQWVFFTCIWQ